MKHCEYFPYALYLKSHPNVGHIGNLSCWCVSVQLCLSTCFLFQGPLVSVENNILFLISFVVDLLIRTYRLPRTAEIRSLLLSHPNLDTTPSVYIQVRQSVLLLLEQSGVCIHTVNVNISFYKLSSCSLTNTNHDIIIQTAGRPNHSTAE